MGNETWEEDRNTYKALVNDIAEDVRKYLTDQAHQESYDNIIMLRRMKIDSFDMINDVIENTIELLNSVKFKL